MSALRTGASRHLRRFAAALRAFVDARSGSTAVEVAVIAGLVSTAIVASLATITGPLGQWFAGGGGAFGSN